MQAVPLAHLCQPLRRTPAEVGMTRLDQLFGDSAVPVQPLGLPVRRTVAANIRALVPAESEPPQCIQDLQVAALGEPRPVSVLDAQHEHAAGAAREREIDQRRVRSAYMRIARR
jgi:hypothetical protein